MEEQIIHYLSSGIKPAQVATIVGCTPAYISQLLAKDSFKERLAAAIADQPANAVESKLDAKFESLEHSIVEKMQGALADAELPALTKALHTVALVQDMKAKRKLPPVTMANGTTINYVTVALPAQFMLAAPVIDMNSNKEIIAIDSQPLAPMSMDGVKGLFVALRNNNEGAQNVPISPHKEAISIR